MIQNVELADVITSAFGPMLQGLWTALVGRVERYDPARQVVDIQLAVKNRHVGETGDVVVESLPVVNNVPLVFLGGGGFRTTYPVQVGDTALVVFLCRSIAQWLVRGGIVDPEDENRHSISDAVAIVGVRDFPHALKATRGDGISIGTDEGATIVIRRNEVCLGGDTGAQPLLKGDSFVDALTTMFRSIVEAVNGMPGGTTASTKIVEAITQFLVDADRSKSSVAKAV